jgi:hypothetical protein
MLCKQVLENCQEAFRKGCVQSEHRHPLDDVPLNSNMALTIGHVPLNHLKFSLSPHGALVRPLRPWCAFSAQCCTPPAG